MNFDVDIGSGPRVTASEVGVTEVIFPEARIGTPEYRNGNDKINVPRKASTLTHYGNLVLKRGAIGSLTWYSWWRETRDGSDDAARTVIVRLKSEDKADVALTWKFVRARPVSHQFAALNALNDGLLMETLELAFDSMDLE